MQRAGVNGGTLCPPHIENPDTVTSHTPRPIHPPVCRYGDVLAHYQVSARRGVEAGRPAGGSGRADGAGRQGGRGRAVSEHNRLFTWALC